MARKHLFRLTKSLLALAILIMPIITLAQADYFDGPTEANGQVIAVLSNSNVKIEIDRGESYDDSDTDENEAIMTYTITPPAGLNLKVGDRITVDLVEGSPDPATLAKGTNPNADIGMGSTTYRATTRLFKVGNCPDDEKLVCWTQKVFTWSQSALLVAAVGAIVIAGIMYMASGGNPQTIGGAKKIIVGALSGVAVIVLGRFFLTQIVGVPWL